MHNSDHKFDKWQWRQTTYSGIKNYWLPKNNHYYLNKQKWKKWRYFVTVKWTENDKLVINVKLAVLAVRIKLSYCVLLLTWYAESRNNWQIEDVEKMDDNRYDEGLVKHSRGENYWPHKLKGQ